MQCPKYPRYHLKVPLTLDEDDQSLGSLHTFLPWLHFFKPDPKLWHHVTETLALNVVVDELDRVEHLEVAARPPSARS